MKTTSELQKIFDCKKWQVKKIAKHQKWDRVNKRGFFFYIVTDEQIAEYLKNTIELSDFGHDYTLDLYKLTLGWIPRCGS